MSLYDLGGRPSDVPVGHELEAEAGDGTRFLLRRLAPSLGAEGPLELLVHVLGGSDAPAVAEHGVLRRAISTRVPREKSHVDAPQVALEETGQRQGA